MGELTIFIFTCLIISNLFIERNIHELKLRYSSLNLAQYRGVCLYSVGYTKEHKQWPEILFIVLACLPVRNFSHMPVCVFLYPGHYACRRRI